MYFFVNLNYHLTEIELSIDWERFGAVCKISWSCDDPREQNRLMQKQTTGLGLKKHNKCGRLKQQHLSHADAEILLASKHPLIVGYKKIYSRLQFWTNLHSGHQLYSNSPQLIITLLSSRSNVSVKVS